MIRHRNPVRNWYVIWSDETGPVAIVRANSLNEATQIYIEYLAREEAMSLKEATKAVDESIEAGLQIERMFTVLPLGLEEME